MAEDEDSLLGKWMHAAEEDTEAIQVFRPSGHALPPSRGRAQLAFYPDHTVKAAGIGSNDVSRVTQGIWAGNIEGGRMFEVTLEAGGEPTRVELSDEDGPVLKLRKTP